MTFVDWSEIFAPFDELGDNSLMALQVLLKNRAGSRNLDAPFMRSYSALGPGLLQ